jgi:hypothetical protein
MLTDGTLTNSTYVAELAEGTGSLGTAHTDPNLDNWPDPNTGWPDVNTTRIAKNALKVSSSGAVCVPAVGRRTITTANAYQKMVKPYYGGQSCWNSFVRVYDSDFHVPLYSSLVVGEWDTLTQAGGSNTELFGLCKTSVGVVCVGRHTADTSGNAIGNPIPVTNVPSWGTFSASNESAILVYYQATNLNEPNDSILTYVNSPRSDFSEQTINVFPNPTSEIINVQSSDIFLAPKKWNFRISDASGRGFQSGTLTQNSIFLKGLAAGFYILRLSDGEHILSARFLVCDK